MRITQRHCHAELQLVLAEVARQQGLADSNTERLSAISRKPPAVLRGNGFRHARSGDRGAVSRIRNARQRLQRLTTDAVAPGAVGFLRQEDNAPVDDRTVLGAFTGAHPELSGGHVAEYQAA